MLKQINKQSFWIFLLITIINSSITFFGQSDLNTTIGWKYDITNFTFWIPIIILVSSIIFTFVHGKWKIEGLTNDSIYPIINLAGITILSFSIIYSALISGVILIVSWIAFTRSAKSNVKFPKPKHINRI